MVYKYISHHKLFRQILIGNLLVTLLAVTFMGVYNLTILSHYIKDSFLTSTSANLKQTSAYIDTYLSNTSRYCLFFCENNAETLSQIHDDLLNGKHIEVAHNFKAIQHSLSVLDYVDSSWLYYNGIVLDSISGVSTLENFNNRSQLFSLIDEGKKNYKYMVPFITTMYTKSNSNYRIMSVVAPLYADDTGFFNGCIVVNINVNSLLDSLYSKSDSRTNAFCIYNNKTKSIIFSDAQFEGLKLPLQTVQQLTGNLETRDNMDLHSYMVQKCTSGISSDWSYLQFVPKSQYSDEIRKAVTIFIFIAAFLLLLELLLSYAITTFINVPLMHITKNIQRLFEDETPTSNELTNINRYLLRQEDELKQRDEIIAGFTPHVLDSVIAELTTGISDKNDLTRCLEQCGVHFQYPCFLVCLFLSDDMLILQDYSRTDDYGLLYDILKEETRKSLQTLGTKEAPGVFTCIFNIEKDFDISLLQDILDTVNQALAPHELSCSASIGTTANNLAGIHNSYTAAKKLSHERFVLGKKTFITKTPPVSDSCTTKFLQSEDPLYYALSQGNIARAKVLLGELTDALSCTSFSHAQKLLRDLFSGLSKNFPSALNFTEYSTALDDLFQYATTAELKECLYGLAENICNNISCNNKASLEQQIGNYIDEHYSEDLSLTSIAEVFKLSPPYLSTLFKASYKISIVDYINTTRVNKSKYFLSNTNISISEIATLVGFISYTTFSRAFKKITGVSPKDYRYNVKK